MQGLTDPPRDHLTADQVRMLLTGEDVQRDHGAELLDENNQVLEDLGQDCRDWTVTYASGTGEEIHGSLDIELTRQLDWGRVRIRPYVDLTLSELATTTRTVIDRPAASVTRTWDDAADWATGTSSGDVDGSSGALRLDLPTPYDPATLFQAGGAGYWLDPSDLSTLFQDTAGTIPVAADGDPVALVLDKSAYEGPNAVTNPTFDSDLSGWTPSGLVSWNNGSARLEDDGVANAQMTQVGIAAPTGANVRIRWTQTLSGTGTQRTRLRVRTYANNSDLDFNYYNGSGVFEVTVTPTDGGVSLWFIVENTDTIANIDDVSVQVVKEARNFTGSTTYRTDGTRHWLEGGSLSCAGFTLKASWRFRVAGQVNTYNGQVVTITGSGTDYIRLSPYVSAERLQSYTRLASQGVGQVTGDDRSVPFGTDTYIKFDVTSGQQSVQQNGNPASVFANSWTTQTLAGGDATLIENSTGMRIYQALAIDRALTASEEADLDAHFEEKRDGASAAGAIEGVWTSPALDLSALLAVDSSLFDWQTTIPVGTSMTVETSVDDGATWQTVSVDGDPIPGATAGGTVLARITLTSDGTETPEVSSLTLAAFQEQRSHPETTRELVSFTGRFYAGVYVLTVPDTHHGRDPLIYKAAGKNLMYLLDRQVGNTYRLGDPDDGPVPTYLDALRQVIADAGLSIPVLLDGDRQDTVLPKPRVWAAGDTRRIDIVNDLMAEIAYTDLYNDEVGTYRAQPIVPLEQRPPEWTFDTEDQATDLVDGDFVESQDLHRAYNTWTFVQADLPYQPFEGDGLFTVPPPAGTPASEVRPAPLQEIQAADQKALEAEGLRIVAADQRLEHEFRINVDPLPIAGHRDCVTFRHAGRVVKMQATMWRLTPYGKAAWTLGGGTGGAAPQRPERQVKATVTQATADVNGNPIPGPLRVVVDGATTDSLASALADDSGVVPIYKLGTRVRVTVRNPEIPLVQGKET